MYVVYIFHSILQCVVNVASYSFFYSHFKFQKICRPILLPPEPVKWFHSTVDLTHFFHFCNIQTHFTTYFYHHYKLITDWNIAILHTYIDCIHQGIKIYWHTLIVLWPPFSAYGLWVLFHLTDTHFNLHTKNDTRMYKEEVNFIKSWKSLNFYSKHNMKSISL